MDTKTRKKTKNRAGGRTDCKDRDGDCDEADQRLKFGGKIGDGDADWTAEEWKDASAEARKGTAS